MANSPVLWGPNNNSINLENGMLMASGALLNANGPKNYITYGNFENGLTTGWSVAGVGLSSFIPTTTQIAGNAYVDGQYIFTVSASAFITIGETLTNNSQTFTVVNWTGTGVLITTGTGAPTSTGTLTKASGSGDATVAFTAVQSTSADSTFSIATTSSGQLAGNTSLNLAASGSPSVVGSMLLSQVYTIDKEDQAKVLTGKFYYSLISGTNINFSGTSSNTFAVYIYDVTNAAWVQPAGVYGMTQGTGVGYCSYTFQTASNASQYQVAIVNINLPTTSFSLYVDDFFLGPQTAPMATLATPWVSYTPTFVGLGTVTNIAYQWRRVGDTLEVEGTHTNGTSTATVASMSLPSVSIDTTKITIGNTTSTAGCRVGDYTDNGGTNSHTPIITATGTSASLVYFGAPDGTTSKLLAQNGNIVANSSTISSISFKVPIAGWQPATVASSDTDTRVIAYRGLATSGATIGTSATLIPFGTTTFDYAAAFSGSTYTVPISGTYRVTARLATASVTLSTTQGFVAYVYVNGAQYALSQVLGNGGSNAYVVTITEDIKCNTGDTIQIYALSSAATTVSSTAGFSSLSIDRISGPAVIAATESVNMSYNTSSSTISSTLATVTYSNKIRDSHNEYASGIYTIPVSGTYLAQAGIAVSGTFTLNSNVDLQIQQSGSATQIAEDKVYAGGAVTALTAGAGDLFYCLAGDTLKVQVSTSATSPSIVSSASQNYFSIVRVGN